MRAALRWVVIGMVGGAAPFGAHAVSPMSNGVGDGEANVPFASPLGTGADEGGRAHRDVARERSDRRKVAGRSSRASDRGGAVDATDPPAPGAGPAVPRTGDDAFERQIWTAP